MKIIVSHDVDLITAWEHKTDPMIPKMVVRSSIEVAIGKIGLKEYVSRFSELLKNKLHNLEELMKFDKENKLSSTFFVGVNRGHGICYSLEESRYWIKKITVKG